MIQKDGYKMITRTHNKSKIKIRKNPIKKISEIIQNIQTWKIIEWDELSKNLIDPDLLVSLKYSNKLFKDEYGNYPVYDVIDFTTLIKIIKSLKNDWSEPKDFSYEKLQLLSNLEKFPKNTLINFGIVINQYVD